ncbi:hypothetical protein NAF17_08340 [Mucilaginibacter sp. RB4R14]|uniref:hypothetical protein n=1 Tax=Mucilaginibacter aurantiaciroseus TaxID=2949308 RepID=UPI00209191AD|nr:hypothetical protein [Mucilaginibacter aurantiaciroseus]MCO5935546.1 hypothetical protein [Mucilaginibacter aurantiaciroseus]
MKKTICMIAVAAISFGSVNAFAATPVQIQQDTTKKKPIKKKIMMKKKMMKDTMMNKDTAMKM